MKKIDVTKKGKLTPFWVVLGVFLVATVVFTIETATSGAQLAKITKQEGQLLEENRRLSSQLMQVSSLTSLEQKAESLGYFRPGKIIYVLEPAGVAKVPQP
jgi:hypothetical protein